MVVLLLFLVTVSVIYYVVPPPAPVDPPELETEAIDQDYGRVVELRLADPVRGRFEPVRALLSASEMEAEEEEFWLGRTGS